MFCGKLECPVDVTFDLIPDGGKSDPCDPLGNYIKSSCLRCLPGFAILVWSESSLPWNRNA